jgi:hypothetical protein
MSSGIALAGGRRLAISTDDAGLRRIRDIVAQRLNLRWINVLIGAGASFQLGGPKIRDVTSEAIVGLAAQCGIAINGAERQILDQLCSTPSDLERILEVLNSAVGYATAVSAPTVPVHTVSYNVNDLVKLRQNLNAMLAARCDLVRQAEVDNRLLNWRPHQEFFRRLLTARRDYTPPKVFTTNYDVAIEYSLDLSGFNYFDGFKGTVRRSFHPEVYSQELYASNAVDQRKLQRVADVLYLYKVHGSITWRNGDMGGVNGSIIMSNELPRAGTQELALIYPTQNKEAETLGFPYSDMLRAFGDALSFPDSLLLVIGYGFRDAHINRIIDRALDSNVALQMLICDPSAVVVDPTAEDIIFQDSAAASYASRSDARIVTITGGLGAFDRFALDVMPDVDADPEGLSQPASPSVSAS